MMIFQHGTLIVIFVIFIFFNSCNGHGFMINPAARSSAWRFGFNTKIHFSDNSLNCGGFYKQWIKNKGKCGPCGDDYSLPKPRSNEFGGKYGKGIIVQKYKKNQIIEIKIKITTNHGGWFEFRLCEDFKNITQKCLDKNVLKKYNESEQTKYYLNLTESIASVKYELPRGFVCKHCVLQWFWNTGTNWGICGNGTSAKGCGPQEQFRNCADISIL